MQTPRGRPRPARRPHRRLPRPDPGPPRRPPVSLHPDANAIVLGDALLDTTLFCSAVGVSAENQNASVFQLHRESNSPGGAANVAANLAALGVTTILVCQVGDDPASRALRELFTLRHGRS